MPNRSTTTDPSLVIQGLFRHSSTRAFDIYPSPHTPHHALIRLILIITFVESFVTAMVERGVSFYAEHTLGFTQTQNLWLALLFGGAYVAGALGSHSASNKFGERRWLILMLVAHIVLHLLLAMEPGFVAVYVFNTLLGATSGSKWPVIESFVSAGQTPKKAAKSVGLFNMAWSSSVVPAVALGGVLIEAWPPSLFLVPGLLNIVVLVMVFKLPKHPTHLPADHPHQPTEGQRIRLRALLLSSRWSMFGSYTLLFLLTPMLPYIFRDLGFTPGPATAMVALIDLARFLTFFILQRFSGWHGRTSLLVWTSLLMPAGFLLMLVSGHLPMVLAGELVFGIAAGLSYYAALYYAMVMKNAAVEAGGAHEGLIGSGFFVGPAIGLGGVYLTGAVTATAGAMAATVSPFLVVCALGGLLPLRHATRAEKIDFPD